MDVVFTEQPFVFQLVAATVHSGEPEIFFEGLVFAWLLAAPCAALVARPASPEVWSCPSPVAMFADCFVAYVFVFIGALVAFTVEVTPVAYVTGWMCTIVDFSVVVTPVAHITVRMTVPFGSSAARWPVLLAFR